MKLMELKTPKGTFIGVHFTAESNELLKQFAIDNGIPNIVGLKEFHTTLVYSRKPIPNVKDMLIEKFNDSPPATPTNKFYLWGDNKDTLVMKITSPFLTERHDFFMSQGGTHDYDSYQPHISLSYNAAGFDLSELKWKHGTLVLQNEYHEYLD